MHGNGLWGDVHIGEFKNSGSARAIGLSRVSENDTEYWYWHPEVDFGGTISKKSPEGVKLTSMRAANAKWTSIDRYALTALLRHASDHVLGLFIEALYQTGVSAGEENIRRRLRDIAGIREAATVASPHSGSCSD